MTFSRYRTFFFHCRMIFSRYRMTSACFGVISCRFVKSFSRYSEGLSSCRTIFSCAGRGDPARGRPIRRRTRSNPAERSVPCREQTFVHELAEGVAGVVEVHGCSTRKIFITSSPRWLITLTAMRPDAGLGKGREMSLRMVSQASLSISALSVVFNALYGSLPPRK